MKPTTYAYNAWAYMGIVRCTLGLCKLESPVMSTWMMKILVSLKQ